MKLFLSLVTLMYLFLPAISVWTNIVLCTLVLIGMLTISYYTDKESPWFYPVLNGVISVLLHIVVMFSIDVAEERHGKMRTTFNMFRYSVIQSLYFYAVHRLMHHPSIYKYIHKQHHTLFTSGWRTALEATPIDHIVGSLGSMYLPLIVHSYFSPVSTTTATLWVCVSIFYVFWTHGRFSMIGFPSLKDHEAHHRDFTVNYASRWIDTLFGTQRV